MGVVRATGLPQVRCGGKSARVHGDRREGLASMAECRLAAASDIACGRAAGLAPGVVPRGPEFRPPWGSPAVVRERLVRIRHAVGFLALLDRAAAILRSVDQLGC